MRERTPIVPFASSLMTANANACHGDHRSIPLRSVPSCTSRSFLGMVATYGRASRRRSSAEQAADGSTLFTDRTTTNPYVSVSHPRVRRPSSGGSVLLPMVLLSHCLGRGVVGGQRFSSPVLSSFSHSNGFLDPPRTLAMPLSPFSSAAKADRRKARNSSRIFAIAVVVCGSSRYRYTHCTHTRVRAYAHMHARTAYRDICTHNAAKALRVDNGAGRPLASSRQGGHGGGGASGVAAVSADCHHFANRSVKQTPGSRRRRTLRSHVDGQR